MARALRKVEGDGSVISTDLISTDLISTDRISTDLISTDLISTDQSSTGQNSLAKAAASKTRLIGWLVSYADSAKGMAHEIRAGRTIISSEELPSEPLIIIEHRELDAPHLALMASPTHRLVAQDIFSQHGSIVVKGRNGSEQVINGPTEIEHGDWIRLGAKTRFQVCLIDGPENHAPVA